jgi:hypothetical protein
MGGGGQTTLSYIHLCAHVQRKMSHAIDQAMEWEKGRAGKVRGHW